MFEVLCASGDGFDSRLCSFGGSDYASYCCDRKSRAACAQSFALWQQATIEITRSLVVTVSRHNQLFNRFTSIIRGHPPRSLHRDHSFIACSPHIHNGVILHAHPVRGESHNQRNTTGEVATILMMGPV